MKCSATCFLTPWLLLIASLAVGQSSSIHSQIQRTYNFQPHLLSNQEITNRSAILDQFWTMAKVEPSRYLPGLRQELSDFKNPPFFLYDGSMLLLGLSDAAADRRIAIAAIHVLEQSNFKVFIPQHVLTLGQDYVLIYLLLPTDQDYWLDPAMDRLKIERDQTAQKSLLLLLWYAQTDAADRAISTFALDASKPTASRTYAKELVHRKDKIGLKEQTAALSSTVTALRQK